MDGRSQVLVVLVELRMEQVITLNIQFYVRLLVSN